jgi:hypothetical protein
LTIVKTGFSGNSEDPGIPFISEAKIADGGLIVKGQNFYSTGTPLYLTDGTNTWQPSVYSINQIKVINIEPIPTKIQVITNKGASNVVMVAREELLIAQSTNILALQWNNPGSSGSYGYSWLGQEYYDSTYMATSGAGWRVRQAGKYRINVYLPLVNITEINSITCKLNIGHVSSEIWAYEETKAIVDGSCLFSFNVVVDLPTQFKEDGGDDSEELIYLWRDTTSGGASVGTGMDYKQFIIL